MNEYISYVISLFIIWCTSVIGVMITGDPSIFIASVLSTVVISVFHAVMLPV